MDRAMDEAMHMAEQKPRTMGHRWEVAVTSHSGSVIRMALSRRRVATVQCHHEARMNRIGWRTSQCRSTRGPGASWHDDAAR